MLSEQIAPFPAPLIVAVLFFLAGILVSAFDRKFNERTGFRYFLLTLPVTWVAWDVITSFNLIQGPEGQFAGAVAPFTLILQPLSIVGRVGLTFLLVLINMAIALGIIWYLDKRREPVDSVRVDGPTARAAGITTAIITLVWFISAGWLFIDTTSGANGAPKTKVATVQIGPGDGYTADGAGTPTASLEPHLAAMTKQAAAQGAEFAVWGEDILHYDPRTDPRKFVQNVAKENKIYIQTGFTVGQPDPAASNLTGLWDPNGDLVGVYYKIHPVILDNEEFVQPHRYPVFDVSFGTVGMLICFDFSFEDTSRYLVQNGAQMLSASVADWTNFGSTRIQTTQIRAAENRVSFVKGEQYNASALIEPTGAVLADADMGPDGGEKLLVGELPMGPRGALYTSWGPIFGYLCVVGVLVRIWIQIRLRIKQGKEIPGRGAPA
ncbi:MAG: nitrilase-related carbon-nitrogen hydrolase [Candidatus Nanopelagicales bacterium]